MRCLALFPGSRAGRRVLGRAETTGTGEAVGMQATVGDRLRIHGHNVGDPDKMGEIVEVHGQSGEPPYVVRFDDGHTGLVFPGPDAVVEHPARKGGGQRKAARK
jgi:Domain of unknown function (DUF1918)